MLVDFFSCFSFVFLGEMGDRTQLLTLVFLSRYRRPGLIFMAILVATLFNHAFAVGIGQMLSAWISADLLKPLLALGFLGFAIWILIPDREEEPGFRSEGRIFLTVMVAFFLAEMGDKTQLVTVALAAQYQSPILVTLSSTLGLMGANALVLVFGQRFLKKVPLVWVRRLASFLFVLFAILILLSL